MRRCNGLNLQHNCVSIGEQEVSRCLRPQNSRLSIQRPEWQGNLRARMSVRKPSRARVRAPKTDHLKLDHPQAPESFRDHFNPIRSGSSSHRPSNFLADKAQTHHRYYAVLIQPGRIVVHALIQPLYWSWYFTTPSMDVFTFFRLKIPGCRRK